MSIDQPGLEPFGFAPAYEVEVDPEFPGDGDWRCDVVSYDRDGEPVEAFASRWGDPVIPRVMLPDGSTWVGMFPSGGLGGLVVTNAETVRTAASRTQLYRILEAPGSHLVIDQLPERRKLLGLPPFPDDGHEERRIQQAV